MSARKAAANASKGPSSAEAEGVPFEEAMQRLTAIVDELEGGDLTLEESLRRFEEGIGLSRQSQKQLDQAEAKVEELLTIDDEGRPITRELELP